MREEPRSLVCPVCGNVNVFRADECLKCGLALAPIREAIGVAAAHDGDQTVAPDPAPAEPSAPKAPPPPLPELPERPGEEPTATFVDSSRFLIRGMGSRAEEIAACFFKQLSDRGIESLKLSVGQLRIALGNERRDSRDYYFAERGLGDEALATMAVRIAPVGKDLFVEWRHYTTPSMTTTTHGGVWWIVFISGVMFAIVSCSIASRPKMDREAAIWFFLSLGVGFVLAFVLAAGRGRARKYALEGFQTQDSTAFQLAVRGALEEAIDLAGISKALIQGQPKDEDGERRVI